MYMIGQVATLRDARVSIEKLHGDVCHGAQQMLAPAAVEPHTEPPSNVAIVGIGVVLPKANSAEEYWNNLLNKVSVIREVTARSEERRCLKECVTTCRSRWSRIKKKTTQK